MSSCVLGLTFLPGSGHDTCGTGRSEIGVSGFACSMSRARVQFDKQRFRQGLYLERSLQFLLLACQRDTVRIGTEVGAASRQLPFRVVANGAIGLTHHA